MGVIRILFISDTHLGFDYPFRPRIKRRRRGIDFFNNFEQALKPAFDGLVDCVVHGGDIFYRSKVPAKLVQMSFEPLQKVADKGIPVYIVPGNHERSAIPYRILAAYPNIFIFDEPSSFVFEKYGIKLALAGFPHERENIRIKFLKILTGTKWNKTNADGYVLCCHQCIEGATVGPSDYTFRYNHDVIKIREIPEKILCVLTGHVHRFQVIQKDLNGKKTTVPVFYPGSIERTSFAEKDEKKGYLILHIEKNATGKTEIQSWKFHELYARPMISAEISADNMNAEQFREWLKLRFKGLPTDSIVKLKIQGNMNKDTIKVLHSESLRSIIPETINMELVFKK